MLTVCGYAQIPNNGFEIWTSTNGYQNPTDWGNLNEITKSYSVATCGKLSPGNPGSFYLVVRTVSVTGKGLIPGRVVSGKIDTINYKAVSGYPFTLRPLSLSYNMQYMVALPSDTAFVSVLLTKWNVNLLRRDTVAYGVSNFNAMAHTWFTNSTYLNYKSGDNPDSACIVISSSNNVPLNNSYMYIDHLLFNGSVIGIDEKSLTANEVMFYPNPSYDKIFFKFKSAVNEPLDLKVIDSKGTLYHKIENVKVEDFIDVYQWPKGVYFLELMGKKTILKEKLIIN